MATLIQVAPTLPMREGVCSHGARRASMPPKTRATQKEASARQSLLATLSRVCRSIANYTLPLLYYSPLFLKTEGRTHFIDTITENPSLGSLIHELPLISLDEPLPPFSSSILPYLPHLEALYLPSSQGHISARDLLTLASLCGRTLKRLAVPGLKLHDALAVQQFGAALGSFGVIEELIIGDRSSTKLGAEDVSSLKGVSLPRLKRLCILAASTAFVAGLALIRMPKLSYLHLFNGLDDPPSLADRKSDRTPESTWDPLISACGSHVKTIKWTHAKGGSKVPGSRIMQHVPQLEELILTEARLCKETGEALNAMGSHSRLRWIKFDWMSGELWPEDIGDFVEMLNAVDWTHFPALRELYFDGLDWVREGDNLTPEFIAAVDLLQTTQNITVFDAHGRSRTSNLKAGEPTRSRENKDIIQLTLVDQYRHRWLD